MRYLAILLVVIIYGHNSLAMCQAGYTDPIFICNYKEKPKILALQKYKGGWSEITFNSLTKASKGIVAKDGTTTKIVEKFNFYKKTDLNTFNYKIERVCNDTPNNKKPLHFVRISHADNSLCANKPEAIIIYPH